MPGQADSFWGFVSVVLPLSDPLPRAELRRLSLQLVGADAAAAVCED